MHKNLINEYVSPETREEYRLKVENISEGSHLIEGVLHTSSGEECRVANGIPDFTVIVDADKNQYAVDLFKDKARDYDKYQHLSFETFYEKEDDVRNSMIDKLLLHEGSRVLEVNAGTGRDSALICKRLGTGGEIHIQDISRDMLLVAQSKLKNQSIPFAIHQSNAVKLPYRDNAFDAVYSFGGVGMKTYSNNKEALAEMVRVVKLGGKVVFGGLSLAPWLRQTHFGRVLANHNEHYANEMDFFDFPIEARNLNLSWILGGAGFVIDFEVGEGEPKADFEYQIPGKRGGTLSTRYLGQLEGVTPETKKLAQQARDKLGISMHEWLDKLIRDESSKILEE